MRDLKLKNNDLALTSQGEIEEVEGLGLLRQKIKIALETQRGDLFVDLSFGVNWLRHKSSKPLNMGLLRAEIASVLDRLGVKLESFEVEILPNRELKVRVNGVEV